jgi:tRNA nucleotidyltransferase/poly(A) polymerase
MLRAIAARLGIRVWLVGGALRDALDGRPVPEVDVAVAEGAERIALAMQAAGAGTAVALSQAAPLVFRIAGRSTIDCAEVEGGSIERDLARRDFTINAMAVDLETGHWVDPFGGVDDLARRRLRFVAPENLRHDPLRALRAARFIATHRLVPERAMRRAVRITAPLLRDVAPERIRAELTKMLEAPRVAPAMNMAIRTGLVKPALGLPARSKIGSALLQRLDRPAVVRLPPPERVRIRLALLAAELRLSPAEAGRWLARRRFSRQESCEVAALLTLARDARTLPTSRSQWSWIRDAGSRRGLALTLLVLLDPRQKTRARRLSRRRPVRSRVRVTGRDVLAWLGISPGPQVGKLLRDLEIEMMRGKIRSRRAARTWLLENHDPADSVGSKVEGLGSRPPSAPSPSTLQP